MRFEQMSDSETETLDWMEVELAEVKAELARERSFSKVYAMIGTLAFLYGLFYGVYLSK